MPSTHPMTVAVYNAERRYARFDKYRDRNTLRRTVKELEAFGHSTPEIAVRVRVDGKTVRRIARGEVDASQRPDAPGQPNLAPANCVRLERTADIALDLACRLRDEDPQLIWDTLSGLQRQHLQELAVILLAATPIDKTKTDIFAWVYDMTGEPQ